MSKRVSYSRRRSSFLVYIILFVTIAIIWAKSASVSFSFDMFSPSVLRDTSVPSPKGEGPRGIEKSREGEELYEEEDEG